jgi:hypothetical protein
MFEFAEGGTPVHSVFPIHSGPDEQIPFRLREHVRRLKRIVPVISISVLALKAQNADLDGDVASVLHHQASEPLDQEIEELEALLESLAVQRAKAPARPPSGT